MCFWGDAVIQQSYLRFYCYAVVALRLASTTCRHNEITGPLKVTCTSNQAVISQTKQATLAFATAQRAGKVSSQHQIVNNSARFLVEILVLWFFIFYSLLYGCLQYRVLLLFSLHIFGFVVLFEWNRNMLQAMDAFCYSALAYKRTRSHIHTHFYPNSYVYVCW